MSSCFPEEMRERVVQAQVVLTEEDVKARIADLIEVTGCCNTCAHYVCSDALAKVMISLFIEIHKPSRDEAESFEAGIIDLVNSLIDDDDADDDDEEGDEYPAFNPSDN